jgi:hypothetical protein
MSRQDVKAQASALLAPLARKVQCVDDGENVVVILEGFTPSGAEHFVPNEVQVAFVVPALFPDACPDPTGFYVQPINITLANSQVAPQNTSETTLLGENWRKFSWAPKIFPWDPAVDTLLTYVATVETRFRRAA